MRAIRPPADATGFQEILEDPVRLAALLRAAAAWIETGCQGEVGRRSTRGLPRIGTQWQDDDTYLTLLQLKRYSGFSTRWLRDRLRNPSHPLPYYQREHDGKIVVRRSEFDRWMMHYRHVADQDVDRIVSEVMAGFKNAG